MAGLELKQIKKSFGPIDVIHGVDLTIDHGELVVFVGPSGCGKSTLLRLIAGLEEITAGELEIGGKTMTDTEPGDRGVAMVFQSYALYPHMTVRQNMGFGLLQTGHDKKDVADRVDQAAQILHLEELMERRPKALSGGQRQRVAIGRAIVREPDVFLFDEPLSNLDAELRVKMRLEIAKLHQELGVTMIYVTHDQVEAMTLADKIVVLRDGIIEQAGSPLELYDEPDNVFVAGFIGSPRMNMLEATVKKTSGEAVSLQLDEFPDVKFTIDLKAASALTKDTKVIAGIRPEHFVQSGQIKIETFVDVIENLGGTSFAYCKSDDAEHPLTIELHGDRSAQQQSTYVTGFDDANVYLFDPKTEQRIR